jgi:hypothetical protein
MRYVTHQFAHVETLERARRWLVHLGIDPSRIAARTHGTINLTVAVGAGESTEVQHVFDVAEASDPHGPPGIWEIAGRRQLDLQADTATSIAGPGTHSHSFVVGWHPQDVDREVVQTDTGIELQRDYQEGRE